MCSWDLSYQTNQWHQKLCFRLYKYHICVSVKNRAPLFPTVSIRCFHGKRVMTVCSLNASLFVDGRSVISLTAKGSNGNVQKWWRPTEPSWWTSQSWWKPSQQCGNTLHLGGNITKSATATPGVLEGQVKTVKILGSMWSNETVLIVQNFVKSYL